VHHVFAGTQVAGSILMSMNRKRASRSQKIFYVVSLLIVFSMVLSLIYVAIAPAAVP
jgi:cell division protein FtsL